MPKIAELFVQHEASLKAELKELDRRTQTSLDAVIHQTRVMGTRLGLVEAQRETDAEKLERLQLDMVAFKTQVEQRIRAMSDDIAQMRAHVGGA